MAQATEPSANGYAPRPTPIVHYVDEAGRVRCEDMQAALSRPGRSLGATIEVSGRCVARWGGDWWIPVLRARGLRKAPATKPVVHVPGRMLRPRTVVEVDLPEEVQAEAERLGMSVSGLVQMAWRLAKGRIG